MIAAPRMRPATGMPWAVPSPSACRWRSPTRSTRPLEHLVGRYARTHGPFLIEVVARRFAVPPERVAGALAALEAEDRVVRGEFRPDGVEREWCDVEVLRQLRRRSLAALRREVEPVEQAALARFLPAWHGIPSHRRGLDALVEALGLLQGAASLPPCSSPMCCRPGSWATAPADLDELCTAATWCGWAPARSARPTVGCGCASATGSPLLGAGGDRPRSRPTAPCTTPCAPSWRERGASFWHQLRARGTQRRRRRSCSTALWDLVWAARSPTTHWRPCAPSSGAAGAAPARTPRGRPRPGRLARLGPPAGAGRWSLVAPASRTAPGPYRAAHAAALQLLERHGVLTREAVLAEGVPGGFAAVYGVLKVLEERGQVRRGYFVPVSAPRSSRCPAPSTASGRCGRRRDEDRRGGHDQVPLVLAATDPAQPYGAALAWPDSPRPSGAGGGGAGGARDGRGAGLAGPAGPQPGRVPRRGRAASWIESLASMVKDGRVRALEIRKVDGEAIRRSRRWPRALGGAEKRRASSTATRAGAPERANLTRVPEGDTIHRAAAALRAALLEKVMTWFEAPRLSGDRPALGAMFERVESRGKHLEIGWDDGSSCTPTCG